MIDIPNRPRLAVQFYSQRPVDAAAVAAIEEAIAELESSRDWVLGAPEFFHENDEGVMVTGGAFEVYSSYQPLPPLPKEIEVRHFEEVWAFIDIMEALSLAHDTTFELYFANELIGEITEGKMDDSIRFDLLDEWRLGIEAMKE